MEPLSISQILFRTFIFLFLTVSLGLLLIPLLKLVRASKVFTPSSLVEILDRSHLIGKKYIFTVKVAEKILVLGITDSNISMLSELPESTIKLIQDKTAQQNKILSFDSFADKLKKLMVNHD